MYFDLRAKPVRVCSLPLLRALSQKTATSSCLGTLLHIQPKKMEWRAQTEKGEGFLAVLLLCFVFVFLFFFFEAIKRLHGFESTSLQGGKKPSPNSQVSEASGHFLWGYKTEINSIPAMPCGLVTGFIVALEWHTLSPVATKIIRSWTPSLSTSGITDKGVSTV